MYVLLLLFIVSKVKIFSETSRGQNNLQGVPVSTV